MQKDKKICIVEDDENLRFLMSHRLIYEGYTVLEIGDGQGAIAQILSNQPDILLLDWMLPNIQGSEICEQLRSNGFENLIVMMTAKSQDIDKIDAFKFGVSDYITKPFNMDVLVAMLESKIKYKQQDKTDINKFGDMEHHPNTHSLIKANKKIELTILENRILLYFLNNRDLVISRESLMMEVWGYNADVNTRTLDMHIVRLRKKIEKNPDTPDFLQTVRGIGYRFNEH